MSFRPIISLVKVINDLLLAFDQGCLLAGVAWPQLLTPLLILFSFNNLENIGVKETFLCCFRFYLTNHYLCIVILVVSRAKEHLESTVCLLDQVACSSARHYAFWQCWLQGTQSTWLTIYHSTQTPCLIYRVYRKYTACFLVPQYQNVHLLST